MRVMHQQQSNLCAGRGRGDYTLEELRLRSRWVADDTDVDIATQVHALVGLLVHAPHELKEETLLDDLVSVYGWRDALDKTRVHVVRVDHRLQLLQLRLRQRTCECLRTLLAVL